MSGAANVRRARAAVAGAFRYRDRRPRSAAAASPPVARDASAPDAAPRTGTGAQVMPSATDATACAGAASVEAAPPPSGSDAAGAQQPEHAGAGEGAGTGTDVRSPLASAQALRPPAAAYAGLLDRLCELRPDRPGGTVVVASASRRPALDGVLESLRRDAERVCLRTLVVDIAMRNGAAATTLRVSSAEAERQLAACREVPLALRDGVTWSATAARSGSLKEALAEAAHGYELVALAGPSLAETPLSARIARSVDGLIIAAHAQRTTKDELRTACEHARMAGCIVVGIIFAEPSHWLAKLVRRM